MKKYIVDIPDSVRPKPDHYEISAAYILANYFKKNGAFIARTMNKTPDICFGSVQWEVKSPTGSSKWTIKHQLYRAAHQSVNVVIDTRRAKMHGDRAIKDAKYHFSKIKPLRRLIIVTKSGAVFEFAK
jgi:hypothetical protein